MASGEEDLSGGNFLGRWTHLAPNGSSMSLQLYYDHTYLRQPYPASPAAPPFYSGFPATALADSLNTDDAQFQYQFTAGLRQQFIWGFEFRATQELDTGLFVRFSAATAGSEALQRLPAGSDHAVARHVADCGLQTRAQ